MSRRHYTANMMKGGAMIRESLALLQDWQPQMDQEEFTRLAVEQNTLGKATRARVRDVVSRVFYRRFATVGAPGVHVKQMVEAGFSDIIIQRLLYFHTALADDLLYDFVVHGLYDLYRSGRYQVDTTDAVQFINDLIEQGTIEPPWSENIRHKTGRGLLAALRDFGLLEGTAKKRFVPVYMPMPVFLYVVHHLHDDGVAGTRLLQHHHWRLFFLTPNGVESLFLKAHQTGHLSYYAAGGITRVEWRYDGLADAVRALVATAH